MKEYDAGLLAVGRENPTVLGEDATAGGALVEIEHGEDGWGEERKQQERLREARGHLGDRIAPVGQMDGVDGSQGIPESSIAWLGASEGQQVDIQEGMGSPGLHGDQAGYHGTKRMTGDKQRPVTDDAGCRHEGGYPCVDGRLGQIDGPEAKVDGAGR